MKTSASKATQNVLLALLIVGSAAASSQAASIWQMNCGAKSGWKDWGGPIGTWVRYDNASYSSTTTASQVATNLQTNYRSQYYNVYFGVGTATTPPTNKPCGGTYVPPKCTTYYAVNVYFPGYGWGSTGWAYTSVATANSVAYNYQRYGYNAYVVNTQRCL